MNAVYKRELRSYFTNIMGYLFIGFVLLLTGIFAAANNFKGGYPNFEYVLGSVSFVYLFVIPILTMRSISEDRHQRTDQLLYSLPLSVGNVVIGKYLAMVTVLLIPTGVMCLYPLILSCYGAVNFSAAYSAICGFFFLGAALIAIGLFMSSLTESQVVAAVLTFVATLFAYLMSGLASLIPNTALASFVAFTVVILLFAALVYYMTKNATAGYITAIVLECVMLILYLIKPSRFSGLFPTVLKQLSLFDHLNDFIYTGIFDLTAIVYYLSVACVFVFLSVQSVEKRRWS